MPEIEFGLWLFFIIQGLDFEYLDTRRLTGSENLTREGNKRQD
jgi:hypothetical protein